MNIPPKHSPNAKRFLIAFILSIVVLGGIFTFRSRSATPEAAPVKDPDHRKVSVAVQSVADLAATRSEDRLPGIVRPVAEARIVAETSGTVLSAPFEAGRPIGQGALLATIGNPESGIETKSSVRAEAIRQAEIARSSARKSYKEAKRLAEKDSNKESRLARDLARLRLESAEVALQNLLESHRVLSPVSGIVIEKSADTGAVVAPGSPIARIAASNRREIVFSLPAEESARLRPQQKLSIETFDGKTLEAIVSSISPGVESAPGTTRIALSLTEKDSLPFGMAVTVLVPSETEEATGIPIPLSALAIAQNGASLFIESDGRAKSVAVRLLETKGESARIETDLPEDTRVIIDGNRELEDGMKIEVREK